MSIQPQIRGLDFTGKKGFTIGDPVTGGIPNRMLYLDPSGRVQDNGPSFSEVTQAAEFPNEVYSVGFMRTNQFVDLSSTGSRLDLLQSGDMANIDWAIYWDGGLGTTALTTGLRVDGFLETPIGLSTPAIYGLSTPGPTQVAFVSLGNLIGDTNFTYNSTTDQLSLGGIGSSAGLVIGGDTQIFRGAANRLDVAAGDSLYIVNNQNGLAVGSVPNTLYTANIQRTSTGTVSTSVAVVNAELNINHAVTAFPTALRMFTNVQAGLNNVGYAAGMSAQVSVTNAHSAQANNITAADFSARWNTNQATASSNALLGARIYTTSNNATISGSIGNLFGASIEAGIDPATTTTTITSSIIAASHIVRVPASGASGAVAFGSDYQNHVVGTSAAISIAGHIRLSPLTAGYGSGTRYPILFNGTSTNLNQIGIWWGTDAGNVGLGRVANSTLGLASGDSFQLTAGDIITDTTTGTRIATSATQRLGFWGATPVVRNAGWSVTNVTADRTYDANATTVDELADVLGTLIGQLTTYGIIAN